VKRVVLDTNLLVLWIVGNLDRTKIGSRRLAEFESAHLDDLNQFANSFRAHVSTPNILTEASNHIGSGKQQLCRGSCDALAKYINLLEEIYVPSVDTLSEPFFAKLGLADAALAMLARRGDVVLTADGPLYGMLCGYGIEVINFWHHVQLTK